jgi:pimeloyl-ACP methyl ester carboxylesterase
MRLFDRMKAADPTSPEELSRTALVTGSVAAGALLASFLVRRVRRRAMPPAQTLRPALDAAIDEIEIMEGRCRFYVREGRGVPIVLLHSINAAASSFEMKPLFEAFAASTPRPIYALDWFGFGLSDRPPVDYTPALYQRQLRRFLSEHIHQPADVVAYSLGCEFAAMTANSHPFLFRRLILIAPTGLQNEQPDHPLRRLVVGASERTGLFEFAFSRLIHPETLRRFYERQIFAEGSEVPDELVNYAALTASARGAAHAPAKFIAGALFSGAEARRAYMALNLPTLILAPQQAPSSIQSFDRLEDVVLGNPEQITSAHTETGLMPQWEAVERTARMIMDFASNGPP